MKKTKVFIGKKNNRKVYPEFLRLIFIFCILYGHFLGSRPNMVGHVIDIGGTAIGVTGFLLMSGFYNVQSKKNRTFPFFIELMLWTFWFFVITLPLFLTKIIPNNPIFIFFGKFPVSRYASWWFLYLYLPLALCQPLLNKLLKKSNKWISFGVLVVSFMVYITFSFGNSSGDSRYAFWFFTFKEIFHFVLFYCLGAWFSLHYRKKINDASNKKFFILMPLFCASIVLLFYYMNISSILFTKWKFENILIYTFQNYCFIIIPFIWIITFDNFKQPKLLGIRKILQWSGKITLPIYLTHSLTWELLDLGWAKQPSAFIASYYWGQFFAYLFISIGVSIIAYLFISVQKRFILRKINNHKTKTII